MQPVSHQSFPRAERLAREVLSLPMDPTISDRQVLRVIAAVRSACVSLGEPSSKAA